MNESEFDQFADEYENSLADAVSLSGESPAFFAQQKVAEVARVLKHERQLGTALQPQTILDFGAGVGGSLPHFDTFFPQARKICAEVSRKSLSVARARFAGRAEFVEIADGALPPAANEADLLFAACVFHHIPHDEHADWLQQLYAAAKPGARLFVFEHNPYNPLTVKTVNACEFDANAKLLKPADLKATMTAAGWSDVRCRYTLFFPGFLARLRSLEPWLSRIPLGAQYYAMGVRHS